VLAHADVRREPFEGEMETVILQFEELDPPAVFGGFLHVVVSHALLVKGFFDFTHAERARSPVLITAAISLGGRDIVEAAIKGKAIDLIGWAIRR
jgi:hypothetical protein